EARGWELWAPLAPLYQAGEYAEVAARLTALVAASPQYPMLFFNLACCESQLGRTADALGHLRHAIGMSEEFRRSAKDDPDLDPTRGDPGFRKLMGGWSLPRGRGPIRERASRARLARRRRSRPWLRDGRRRQRRQAGCGGPRAGPGLRDRPWAPG